MIHGVVNFRYELTLPLMVGNSNEQREFVNTVIDTGFDGFLSLPSEIIVRLELPWRTSNVATLGDGSKALFDFYAGTVIWDGQYRSIDIAESETEPLLGLSILRGYRLQVDNVEGGIVKIEAL
ncbi:MAG: clan AA aspartic protease [Acaryochloridaceae cyanobacterium RU_4_10]|nr:clan AA aspartic protease [Acaryochloridaceae cyanobacterium RU_4_10]